MKILLISSMVTHSVRFSNKWRMSESRSKGAFSPSGLMYIAGYLREHASHHHIKIIDANLLSYTQEDIRREVMNFHPDVVGLTILSAMLYDCLDIMQTVKSVSNDISVIVGGAHPTLYIDETMAYPEVDFAVKGEGEIVFAEFIEALEGKKDLTGIRGLVYRDNKGNVIKNEGVGYIDDLDSIPQPAFDLLPFKQYYSIIGTGCPTGILCSSRGCPHKCTFCSKLFDTYRERSPENIIEEMKLYYEHGIREFMFFDDMFNLQAERAIRVSRAISGNFNDIEWSFRGRADQITEELAEELRKSNCSQVTLGAEAHKNEILKELKTGKKIESLKKAVNVLRKNRIEVNTNWIIGLPQHKSAKDIKDMLNVVFDIDSDYAQFAILGLYDDVELFEDAVRRKLVKPDTWKEFFKKPTPHFLGPTWEEHLTLDEQSALLRYCWVKFYFRQKVLIRNLASLKNWGMFKIKFEGFITMLTSLFYPIISQFKKIKP